MSAEALSLPFRITSKIVRGFGRGSKDLGIATANMDRAGLTQQQFADLPTGIYFGFASIEKEPAVCYNAAISIGYNPTYNNKEKTIEPHFITPPGHSCRYKSSCGETLLVRERGSSGAKGLRARKRGCQDE